MNRQLATWQSEIADLRVHGTTHEQPIQRFAQEVSALIPIGTHRSFIQSVVRERVVAEDWLISVDANRYSVPFGLIGKTVQVHRQGAQWVIRYRNQIVAQHEVLAGRSQLSVQPEHGPGAVARNTRQRFSQPVAPLTDRADRDVQIRDLAVYEQLLDSVLEAA